MKHSFYLPGNTLFLCYKEQSATTIISVFVLRISERKFSKSCVEKLRISCVLKRWRNFVISCVFPFFIVAKCLFRFVGEWQKSLVALMATQVSLNNEISRSFCGKFEYRFILTATNADPVELFTV